MRHFQPLEILLCCLLAGFAQAASPYREVITFQSVSNTGFGRSLYVVGSHPDLGNWDPAKAHRLAFQSGNIWSGRVAVQAGTALSYKFISRDEASSLHCDGNNAHWMPDPNALTNVPAQPAAPFTGKTVYYHTGWTSAFLIVVQGTNGSVAPLERMGAGRFPGEYLYRGTGIGEAGEPLQFVPSGWLNGTQYYDNVQGYPKFGTGDYYTSLDAFFVQDGQVYNYWPPASPSPSTIITTFVASDWAPQIPARNIRIYLPRGYTNNTWKRYPVVYLQDGQNVFRPGGDYGCWFAEDAASREMGQGRAREAILVGVDNSANRFKEYCPPGDSVEGNPAHGELYANFLVHNVRLTLDYNYRTLNDRAHTMTMGSSLGGLISTYLGLQSNVFGVIGPMSPSYWTAPNLRGWIASNDTSGIRIYLDWGTEEGSTMWPHGWTVRDAFLRDGYSENKDLLTVIGCGHIHNEAAWSNRLPIALRYMLPVLEERNGLAHEIYPTELKDVTSLTTSVLTGSVTTLMGWRYAVEASTNLTEQLDFSLVATTDVERLPWSNRPITFTNPVPGAAAAFFRARGQ